MIKNLLKGIIGNALIVFITYTVSFPFFNYVSAIKMEKPSLFDPMFKVIIYKNLNKAINLSKTITLYENNISFKFNLSPPTPNVNTTTIRD